MLEKYVELNNDNVIVAGPYELDTEKYSIPENAILVTNISPEPQVGWSYLDNNWIEEDPTVTLEKYVIEIEKLRAIRNDLLYKSDWIDLPNTPISTEDKQEWLNYRQALRDMTIGYEPKRSDLIKWPKPPYVTLEEMGSYDNNPYFYPYN